MLKVFFTTDVKLWLSAGKECQTIFTLPRTVLCNPFFSNIILFIETAEHEHYALKTILINFEFLQMYIVWLWGAIIVYTLAIAWIFQP